MYSIKELLKYLDKTKHLRRKFCTVTSTTPIGINNANKTSFEKLLKKYQSKIMFNSYLESEKLNLSYFKYYIKKVKATMKEQENLFHRKSLPPIPLSLQYVVDKNRLLEEYKEEENIEENKVFQLPFSKSLQTVTSKTAANKDFMQDSKNEHDQSDIDRWMTNYEYFDDTELDNIDDNEWEQFRKNYGTPDPNSGVSIVPCGGCGALLHCSDPAIPGYLPNEIFNGRSIEELQGIECQRCHFLKEYNVALDVNVEPEEYEKLLQSIRRWKTLIILMVDLLDYPCSIWPGIVDIIGTERPLIIVGNKVDLIPGDGRGYLKRIKESLLNEIKKTRLGEANVKDVILISAKTGYGVEELISSMFKIWLYKGDVILIGCTNVGKSSLFNALIQSDYCKVQATDIIRRATVSQWPGTTLNLLKFPINRPSVWKIKQRTDRLKSDTKLLKAERELLKLQAENHNATIPALIGHIGRTFSNPNNNESLFQFDGEVTQPHIEKCVNIKDKIFAKSKWFYDTPGVIHPDQVLPLLTTEELLLTLPKSLIRPQTYFLYQETTIFIGGLARIDFLKCSDPCRFIVFCSENLPITISKTEDASELYQNFLGTELFGVPIGNEERLSKWPGLKKHSEYLEFIGEGSSLCCGDVILSSIAWVSISAPNDTTCRIAAWTPEARGIHTRKPSLLKQAIMLKGKRIRDTPAYRAGKLLHET